MRNMRRRLRLPLWNSCSRSNGWAPVGVIVAHARRVPEHHRALKTATPMGRLVGARRVRARSLIHERTLAGLAKLHQAHVEAAKEMLADPKVLGVSIARQFGVSVPTFYR